MIQLRAQQQAPPMGQGMGAGGMGAAGGMQMMTQPTNTVTNPEVELFLQHNPVEPHAATRLRSLPMELQKIVLSRGSLFGGRDPTAVLLGRVRAATRGQSGPMMGGAPGGVPWSGTTAFTPQQPAQQQPPQMAPPQQSPQGGYGGGGDQQANASWQGQGQKDDVAAWARDGQGGANQVQDEAW